MTLQEIINAKEGDHFEFKKAENRYDIDEGAKYLSAMSIYDGGRLVLVLQTSSRVKLWVAFYYLLSFS
jgi:hypothetical protein